MKVASYLLLIAVLSPAALLAQGEELELTLLAAERSFAGGETVFVEDDHLWIDLESVPAATGFEFKPEGLCSEDLCIPLPADGTWLRGKEERRYLDLSAFAEKLGQVLLRDRELPLWALAEAPMIRERNLASALAPDFELPDRNGRARRLSDFRGKKVLLLTWASW